MNFAKYYFIEVNKTPKKNIPHIYGGEHGEYSMGPDDFIEIINYIKSNGGYIDPSNISLSEKIDGFSLKFGLNKDNKFFVESARSGPIYDEGKFREFTINKKGKTTPIAEAFEAIFKILKNNKELQDYLKNINTDTGIKIQVETFYLPLAKEQNNDLVKFVATWYRKDKLGKIATFVVLNVYDGIGNELSQTKVNEIKRNLKKLNTDDIKFEDSDIMDFGKINLSQDINNIEKFINNIEREQGRKINEILLDKRKDLSDIKKEIKSQFLKFQKEFSDKLGSLVKNGKFGEYEGLVFKLANGIMFKVVTERFRKAKQEYNQEYKYNK